MTELAYSRPLIAARRARRRPSGIVTIADGLPGLRSRFPDDCVLVADLNVDPMSYDLWFVADLYVEVATAAPMRRCIRWEQAVLQARPRYMRWWLIDIDALVRVWPPHPFRGRYFTEGVGSCN